LLHAFNWSHCLATVSEGVWYVVAFRSIRNERADPARLKLLDDRAYDEAMQSSGLLAYFRGDLTERRECLSVCVWESREAAAEATRLEAHSAAADITDEMYDLFELERWQIIKHAGGGRMELRSVTGESSRYSPRRSAWTPAHPSLVDPVLPSGSSMV
jgi:hypothetical protein